MDIESILIEGAGSGQAIGDINDEEIEKLIKFYAKNGFQTIEDTQYLVKKMDYKY